ncbi:sugar diacid utilization regulator [Enterococcus sp. PF1-24]|uniref:PucR family transcriptional regulator n=1 Tax=unclassified Enterococcus TaxID=2608891 RepID=UPI002475B131|nr:MULTISPECIES: helix-turn-helix domain-containing protein [unclassified Enterococcus]MDH6365169.1 sugar diacid utilization regulator [Enterococcus sp. PFB1-1]MDH6402247.1 sugar diacid utilization regulator [Enterococcus sp. PF1-24]
MRVSDLMTFFPNAEQKEFPSYDEKYLSIPYGEKYLWIPNEWLSEKEKSLIAALAPNSVSTNKELGNHFWYKVLFGNQGIPHEKRSYRVIQLKMPLLDEKNDYQKIWQESFKAFFPKKVDAFFLSNVDYLLIEELSDQALYMEDLEGIFTTLDMDFGITTYAFIGEFYEDTQNINRLFHEERKIFQQESEILHGKQVFRFADVALHYFTKDKIGDSRIIEYTKEKILHEDEAFRQLVRMMWKHFGNITSVSKEMYTHRNTINYRIDRLAEQAGINLKNPDDLMLCYLILLDE